MKKRFFALVLALCMAFLYTCGGSSGGITPIPDESPPIEPPLKPPAAEEEFPEENPPEEAAEPEPREPEPEKLKGLIFRSSSAEGYEISCFDPETGSGSLVSRFPLWTGSYEDPPFLCRPRGIVDRTMFSSDYDKMACTKVFTDDDKTHAGWLDTNGNFFDVTEVLDRQSKSDFDNPVRYEGVGFQDSFFGYARRYVGPASDEPSYVPLNNINPSSIQAGWVYNRANKFYENGKLGIEGRTYWFSSVTSWIGDTRCIVSRRGSSDRLYSRILDTGEKPYGNTYRGTPGKTGTALSARTEHKSPLCRPLWVVSTR